MLMIVRATCWVLKCTSQSDDGHQLETAFAVLTLPGAGREVAVRDLKTCGVQPRTRRDPKA